MAGSSLLALIDDISSVLDDVATMTKVATKKTAGVLGDDLALNAEQVSGVHADRELPVVWAVARGSMLNKVILVPAALLISWWSSTAVTVLLMIGGAFLCFEGFEKVLEKIVHRLTRTRATTESPQGPANEKTVPEADKIRGAIRTDFVLSAEVIVISLGTLVGRTLGEQLATLVAISVLMTVGVYGLVAAIVKLDDAGLWLCTSKTSSASRALGRGLLLFAPRLMKSLGLIGTIAMFLVGGGIIAHALPSGWTGAVAAPEWIINLGVGFVTGAGVAAVWGLLKGLRARLTRTA